MGEVISIFKNKDVAYERLIANMPMMELLEEMVRFQEERSKTGILTKQDAGRGIILFKQLESKAVTPEMKQLTSGYRKHLELKIKTL